MTVTWERFLQLCDEAVSEVSGGCANRHDLADCVDPADHWDGECDETSARINAQEFARELLEEEGFPLDDEPDESMDGDHETGLASAGFGTDEDYGGGCEYL